MSRIMFLIVVVGLLIGGGGYWKTRQSRKVPTLQVCLVERDDFDLSQKTILYILQDIKEFGGWQDVSLRRVKAVPPTGYELFFPSETILNQWVDTVVRNNCGSGLKIVLAGGIENERFWGYARKQDDSVIMLWSIRDSEKLSSIEAEIKAAAVLHEIGHLWGLAHNEYPNCLMNARFDGIKLGDGTFNEQIANRLENQTPDVLRKDLGLTFCNSEANVLQNLASPLLNHKW